MTVNERIIAALKPEGFPVKPDLYDGQEDIFYTFNFDTRGELFADDAPQCEVCLIQVHLTCPRRFDSVELRRRTVKRLFQAGFTYPEVTNASDKDAQHYVFECEWIEGVEADGQI